ncbi:hypothetical protein BJ165DRAFT_1533815 [Panaeolus papilionaceus]|nr:hypothetical protein BJ165DRAFT_1533815 [Panaeolus papilionaceus]
MCTKFQFALAALTAHGYQKAYVVWEVCGPGMQVSWSGFAGGKAKAPVIQDDSDFNMMQVQLREQFRRSKGKLNTVCVTFNLDSMDRFKNHKRPLSPPASSLRLEGDHIKMSMGTHVPSMDTFSEDQIALRRAIDDIKAIWVCQKHGFCFVSSTGAHVELNRFRMAAFGSAVVAGTCEVAKGPPPELLQAWAPEVSAVGSSATAKVPHGRSGPGKVTEMAAVPSTISDPATLLLSTVVPMVTMMAQQTILPPSSPPVASSPPPPALEDELSLFLDAFGRSKGISEEIIRNACLKLQLQHYSPESLSELSLSVERIQELTGFHEGEVYSLRQFARKWCGKVDAKRAKHSHDHV